LLKIDAKVRFLSIEPLLGPMPDLPLEGIQWVIIGGESGGEEARPTSLSWIREIINRCNKARVQVFVKQLGRVWAKRNGAKDKKVAIPRNGPRTSGSDSFRVAQKQRGHPRTISMEWALLCLNHVQARITKPTSIGFSEKSSK